MKSSIISSALALVVARAVDAAAIPDVSSTLQNILQNTHGSDLYTYPTDLTRGIIPKPFHSHNDYWRDVPFYSGLSYGAVSTEADVWLINETLYVGHEPSALTHARTLSALYISPILDTLQRENPTTSFVSSSATKNGVFDTSSSQTLYLWIDLKTAASPTFAAVRAALAPLRRAGYLTTFHPSNGSLVAGPVTVIGTGNTRLEDVLDQTNDEDEVAARDVFFDAPLAALPDQVTGPEVSPVASADFGAVFGGDVRGAGVPALNATQLATLREQVGEAHKRGVGARYWGAPGWPVGTRNAVWRTLLDEGVDLLNVDDLEGAAGFWEME
ncbi:altered inheritance of mitochondria protein [Diplodia corticola]|uniref:Altered inheritance of mitochondria protein n=1 Tax=Diplodia corticola TaxID=236234 RepID=A0A1J9RLL6_9PEZI|nr:altered inheritance of mitochondria protein [Diplodia corticola]OJD33467.1 altered inheritance of mitochondria protein [Diplodia corticola]